MLKKLRFVFYILVVILVGSLIYLSAIFFSNDNVDNKTVAGNLNEEEKFLHDREETDKVTLSGYIACMPVNRYFDYTPEFDECVLGFKTFQGVYYILTGFENLETYVPAEGQKILVTGKIDENVTSYFDIGGKITVYEYEILE